MLGSIQDYLKSLPNIDWDKPIIVNGTHTIVEEMKSILKCPGLCGPERTPELNFDGHIYAYKGTFWWNTVFRKAVTTSVGAGKFHVNVETHTFGCW